MKQTQNPAVPADKSLQALRKFALALSEAEEGVACAGTSLEKRTIKVCNKAFLFLGASDAMFKLAESVPEAKRYAAKDPAACKVGASGWVTLKITPESAPPQEMLQRWIGESYRLLAPKSPATKTQKPTKNKPARKKSKRGS